MLNAITIDVEDYFHTEAMTDVAPRSNWDTFPSRVERNVDAILEHFGRYQVKGTFFVLGWVAERFPEVVRKIHQQGHEVGCHSYWHRAVFRLTKSEFHEDTHRAKAVLEDLIGAKVLGYRAPSFSITPSAPWGHEVLESLGFQYDSSVNPIRHAFYGNPNAPRSMYRPEGSHVLEIPIATLRVGGNNFPIGGGAYLRLLPYTVMSRGIRHLNDVERIPAMVYLHPWEVDVDQPRLPAKAVSRFRQYMGLATTLRKLERLIKEFQFGTAAALIAGEVRAQSVTA